MSRKNSPETVAAALAALATGQSFRDVARAFHVTATTVQRWRDAAEAATPAPALDGAPPISPVVSAALAAIPTAPVLPDLPPIPEDADTLERARALLARVEVIAEASLRAGNVKAAQSAMRDALKAINDIARYEATRAKTSDGLHISQEEIDEARETVRARFAAIADRPLLCASCGRKLAISWGENARKDVDT